jgi:hypothetical protein
VESTRATIVEGGLVMSVNDRASLRRLLREVNDRILEIGTRWQLSDCPLSFYCECGGVGCAEHVPLSADEYLAIRATPEALLVDMAHYDRAVGRVCKTIERRGVVVCPTDGERRTVREAV